MGGGRWASSGRLRDPSRRIPVLGISQLHNASRVLRASECQRACWGIVFNISGQLFHEKLNSALKSGAEDFRAGPLSSPHGKAESFFLPLPWNAHLPPSLSPDDPFILIPSLKPTHNRYKVLTPMC